MVMVMVQQKKKHLANLVAAAAARTRTLFRFGNWQSQQMEKLSQAPYLPIEL